MKWFGIFCLTGLLLLSSCEKNRFNVPGRPDFKITINRFDQDFQTEETRIDSAFLYLYATSIVGVGEPGGDMYQNFYDIFHKDADISNLYDSCERTFVEVRHIEKELTWAFFRLRYFFPDIPIPKVYMHISAYGESIVSAPGILSASLDKYLGTGHPMYRTLFQPYQAQRMYPEKIVSDYMIGWIRSELTVEKLVEKDRLLDYMLYEGKILYLLKVVLPDEPMENITALTTKGLKWCMDNEKNMWNSLMRLQHLYSSDRLIIAKYIEEAPKTAFFPDDSPGRAITWTGYRIIESYLEKNEKVMLPELLLNTDAQAILAGSVYHP
jgi:hypothetical protein